MPEKDGFEATRAIRRVEQERRLEPVPIVALTADLQKSVQGCCSSAGMNGYLKKPCTLQGLVRFIPLWNTLQGPLC